MRGSILRSKFADMTSPIAYGYEGADLPVYFNQSPVLNAASGFGGAADSAAGAAARRARTRTAASART